MSSTTIYPYGTTGELPANIGIIDDLVTGGRNMALSAEQGVVLNGYITTINGLLYKIKNIVEVNEDGFYLVDNELNIGMKLSNDGLQAQGILNYELIND